MRFTVRLDSETERCLMELLDETGQDKSTLVRQLIQERWQRRVPHLQALQVMRRSGGGRH